MRIINIIAISSFPAYLSIGFCNVDVLRPGGADILVSSLTKQFSGSNNAMGGSLVLNPYAVVTFSAVMFAVGLASIRWHCGHTSKYVYLDGHTGGSIPVLFGCQAFEYLTTISPDYDVIPSKSHGDASATACTADPRLRTVAVAR